MPEKCVRCSELLDSVQEAVKCSDCAGLFHPACCGQSADMLRKLRSSTKKWRCVACKGENTSTNSRSDAENADSASVIEMFKTLRNDISKNHEESKRRFDGLEDSFKEVKAAVEECRRKIHALEGERDELHKRCDNQEKSLQIASKTIGRLEMEIQDLQQYSRRNNLEIKGIPLTTNENVYQVLECISRALSVPYERREISTAHRLPVRRQGDVPVIICAFVSRSTREMWLSAARARRLTTVDVSPHLVHGPVYINPHLTGYNKSLLGRAKKMVREGKLQSAWTNEGKVMFRVQEKGPAIRASHMQDLDRLCD